MGEETSEIINSIVIFSYKFHAFFLYSKTQIALNYLKYYLTASNGKGHGIHSPFVFEFITEVLNDDRSFYAYKKIEQLRDKLLHDKTVLQVEDFGAGSVTGASKERSVQQVAKWAAKPAKLAQLLFRIVNYYQCKQILELGTSLGISGAYMAAANDAASLITIEGSTAIAEKALANFNWLQLKNIQLLQGNFDTVVPRLTASYDHSFDLVFIDGNHRATPTWNYFIQLLPKLHDDSICIFDDIHWSRDMETAWQQIKEHEAVTLTIDLFFIGLVFFRKDFKVKQHFVIRY